MKLTISKEVCYARYLVHPVDKNGEVDYSIIDEAFEDDMLDESTNYWRIEGSQWIDSVTDEVPYKLIKAYVEYLEGWFETHDEDDAITYNEWTRSDEYELLEKN